jgi:hypothetical protein
MPPDDVVIQICQHLSVRDILAFRQVSNEDPDQSEQSQSELTVPKTCKHAFAVSCLKILWISSVYRPYYRPRDTVP